MKDKTTNDIDKIRRENEWLRDELKYALLSERFLKQQLENHYIQVTNCPCGLCRGIKVSVDHDDLNLGNRGH